jgi:hypothetical protein
MEWLSVGECVSASRCAPKSVVPTSAVTVASAMAAKLLANIERHDAALAFARELIRRLHSGGEACSYFEPIQSRAFVRSFLRLGLSTAKTRMWLVELALAGEEEADIILRDAIIEMQSARVEMPTELIQYNMTLVRAPRPVGWAGPKRKNEILRNICIAMVVAALVDRFGLKPTGHSVRQRSACAIVAQALAEIRMALGYEAVASIWKMYGRSMPTTHGWRCTSEVKSMSYRGENWGVDHSPPRAAKNVIDRHRLSLAGLRKLVARRPSKDGALCISGNAKSFDHASLDRAILPRNPTLHSQAPQRFAKRSRSQFPHS